MDAASLGACEVEEFRGRHREPHGSDVLLLAKRYMADAEPFRVICIVPAEKCAQLRVSFAQPSGVAERRAIAEKLKKNLLSKAPACRSQGSITRDAESYLLGWVSGTWPRIPRPSRYRFLELRRFETGIEGVPAVPWEPPARFRVYTILHENDAEDGDDVIEDDDNDGPVQLVIA